MVSSAAGFGVVAAQGITGVRIGCPKCFKPGELKHAKARLYYAASKDELGNIWWIGRCPDCGQNFLVANDGDAVFPPTLMEKQPDIPDDVIGAYSEARRCFIIGCYEATILMTRRALELATCKAYPEVYSLTERITKMVADGTLHSGASYSEAELLAKLGNEGNHSHARLYKNHDDGAPMAARAMELLERIIVDMYRRIPQLTELNSSLDASYQNRRSKPK